MTDGRAGFQATPRTRWILACLLVASAVAIPAVIAQERPSDPSSEVVVPHDLGRAKALAAQDPGDEPGSFAVPANDTCAGALSIPAAGPFPHLTAAVDLFDATSTGDPNPSCSFTGSPCTTAPTCHSRGIWWTFTPSVTAAYRFSSCGSQAPQSSRTDTVLSVYTSAGGCGGPFTEISCNDDDASCAASQLQSSTTVGLTAGTTYYVLAFSWNSIAPPAGASTVQLQVQQIISNAPANDTCSGAIPLGADNFALGTNQGATADYSLSGTGCFTGLGQTASTAPGRDTVYSFTAPAAGSYSFKVTTFDTANGGNLVLYSSPTCPAPGSISCSAPVVAANRSIQTGNQITAESVRCVPLAQDEQVFLFVDEHVVTAAGGGHLIEATRCGAETEPNGTPAQAQALPVDTCPLIDGSISAGDVDFYSLGTPPAGTRVFAVAEAVMSNNTDFDLRVTTTTDTLEYDDLDNSSSFGANSGNIAGRPLTGAGAFLRVNHFTATVNAEPYRLYAVTYPPGADPYGSSSSPEERDLTNDTLEGSEMAANNYFRATAGAGGELDAFLFCANEGDIVTMHIDADPSRNLTPFNPAIFLFNEAGQQLLGLSDAGVTSNNTSGAGSLTASTPFSPGEVAVWRARYTGAYYAGVNAQPGGAGTGDYLLSIAKNCSTGDVSDTATVTTDLTAEFPTVGTQAPFNYTISLANTGTKTAQALEFTFALPAGVVFLDLDGTGTDSATCSQLPTVGAGGTVVCRVECLRPGGTFDFDVLVEVTACFGDTTLNASVTVDALTALDPGSVLSDSVAVNVDDDGSCDDGNPCTDDACNGAVCQGVADDTNTCDDSNACTDDSCSAGSCVGAPNSNPCNDGLFCTLDDVCSNGTCTGPTPNPCNDDDPCTIDQCDESSGCFNSFSEGEICDDGDPCTAIDICLLDPGGCVGFEPLGSPSEVGGVGFAADKETISWNSDAAAFTYDAVRGDVSALPVGPGGGDEVCFDGISGTSTSDAAVPGPGLGFWYLVRGENTCGPAGTYGNDSGGNPRTTTTCP